MKNTLLNILTLILCSVCTISIAQTKKERRFLPVDRVVENSDYLNKRNRLEPEEAVARVKAKIKKDLSLRKDNAAEFYEYEDYLIKVDALDVKQMKSGGYTGVKKYYDTLLLENKGDTNVRLDYRNLDQQESLIMSFKSTNQYIFILENSNYSVSGVVYSYSKKYEETSKFVNKLVNSLRLK